MKKLLLALFVVILLSSFSSLSVAETGLPSVDRLYKIELPNNVDDPSVIKQEVASWTWYCDDAQTQQVNTKSFQYFYEQSVRGLNEWNAGKVTLSGVGPWGTENKTGFLTLIPERKDVLISLAVQDCWNFTYNDDDTCTIYPEYTCSDAEFLLTGTVILTVPQYLVITK